MVRVFSNFWERVATRIKLAACATRAAGASGKRNHGWNLELFCSAAECAVECNSSAGGGLGERRITRWRTGRLVREAAVSGAALSSVRGLRGLPLPLLPSPTLPVPRTGSLRPGGAPDSPHSPQAETSALPAPAADRQTQTQTSAPQATPRPQTTPRSEATPARRRAGTGRNPWMNTW